MSTTYIVNIIYFVVIISCNQDEVALCLSLTQIINIQTVLKIKKRRFF